MKIIVNKDRVKNLIIRIVRKLEIYGLYRVQVNFRDVDEKHTDSNIIGKWGKATCYARFV